MVKLQTLFLKITFLSLANIFPDVIKVLIIAMVKLVSITISVTTAVPDFSAKIKTLIGRENY